MASWYISSAGWTAVAAWQANHVYAAGAFVRQTSPTTGSERVFKTTSGGTSGSSEPAAANGNPWAIGKGQTTTDNTVTWTEVTGQESFQVAGAWAPFARLATMFAVSPGPLYVNGVAVSAGGTGYAVGDVLSRVIGTAMGDPAYVKVSSVSAGVITGLTILSGGSYSALPGTLGGLTTITGSGSSATVTSTSLNYGIVAGDNIYIGSNSAETQASAMTLAFPGTAASPNQIICVDETGTGHIPPTSADVKTTPTASVTTTGASNMTVGTTGVYISGIAWNCGSGANSATITIGTGNSYEYFKNCSFNVPGTSVSTIAPCAGTIIWDNCTVSFGSTSSKVNPTLSACQLFNWKNTNSAVQGATLPTSLFNLSGTESNAVIEGVDLSALGSGKTLLTPGNGAGIWSFKDCKLGSSVTVSATPSNVVGNIYITRCDSDSTNYRNEKYHYAGTLATETTIVRTGGATDGTTPVSHKIVTTANSKWQAPFEALPISIWNETTGSTVNVTVCGIWGAGAVPNNDDIWMDVEYLGDSSTPMGSFNIGTKSNILATGSALASDGSTWGGSTTAFKFSATITPQKKGPIVAYIRCAKASTTFYIDPLITLS